MSLNDLHNAADKSPRTPAMPVLFVGHGNPMNALADNAFTRTLASWGRSIVPHPSAILVVSAHWLTRGTHVTVAEKPRTIHDFGGFPEALYQIQYPAPGAPEFARMTKKQIQSIEVLEDARWGLDHGAWTVLRHMYPEAAVPVYQLSIDFDQPPEYHFALAHELTALRERGVLILASGNIVHNLREADFDDRAEPFDWAIEFDQMVKGLLDQRDFSALVAYKKLGTAATQSIPTNDHYLPMLYALGAVGSSEELRTIYEEIQNASISMRCFQIG